LLPTLRALNRNFYALSHPGSLGRSNGGQSFVLGLLAGFAPLRFVFQSLVMEKACSPDVQIKGSLQSTHLMLRSSYSEIWDISQFMDFFPFLHDSFSQGRSEL